MVLKSKCPRQRALQVCLARVGGCQTGTLCNLSGDAACAAAGAEPAGGGAGAEAAPPGAHLLPRGQGQARLPAPPQLLQVQGLCWSPRHSRMLGMVVAGRQPVLQYVRCLSPGLVKLLMHMRAQHVPAACQVPCKLQALTLYSAWWCVTETHACLPTPCA